MSTVQSINGTLAHLTANTFASGVVQTISGVIDDANLNLMFSPLSAGVVTIYSGDYANAVDSLATTVAASGYAITGLDGSKYRKEDGTIDFSATTSGTYYAWSRD